MKTLQGISADIASVKSSFGDLFGDTIRVATTDFEIKAEVDRLAKKFEQEIEGIDENAFAKLSKELKDSIEKVKTGKADKFQKLIKNLNGAQKKTFTDKRQELVNILAKKEAPKEPETGKPNDKPVPQNPDVKPELIYVTPIVGGVVPNASDPAACDIEPFVEITPRRTLRRRR